MITNFESPISGSQLTESELIITLAFLLRGNYNPGNRSYICVSKARDPKVKDIIKRACEELKIPKYNVADLNPDRLYYGGQNLKMLFAKQSLIPGRYRWKQLPRIPESWIDQISIPVLHRLLNFTKALLPNKDLVAANGKFAGLIQDKALLHESLVALFKPIAPSIEIRYESEHVKGTCVIGLDDNLILNCDQESSQQCYDDISDLL